MRSRTIKQARGWQRALAYPIKLRDGHVIETMAQAAGLMIDRLPKARQVTPLWQKAAEMLMDAHASGKPADLEHAHRAAAPSARLGRLGGLAVCLVLRRTELSARLQRHLEGASGGRVGNDGDAGRRLFQSVSAPPGVEVIHR